MQSAPLWFIMGTALVPLVSLFFPDIRRFFTDRAQAKKVVGDNLDPILKTADELYSKVYDLAKTDFKEVYAKKLLSPSIDLTERIYILYLFASFFGRISILRQQNYYSQLSKIKKGRRLLKFLMSFESRSNVRFINRANQRLIGDAMVKGTSDKLQLYTLYEFYKDVKDPATVMHQTIQVVDDNFQNSFNRDVRQRILYFGILIKAFIDYFDSRSVVTKKRQVIFTNKLASHTKYELKYKLFGIYLKFVKKKERYYV